MYLHSIEKLLENYLINGAKIQFKYSYFQSDQTYQIKQWIIYQEVFV